jgi:hypothetical protein
VLIAFRGATYVPVNAAPSLPILGFAFLLSILTGVVFGVAPAWIGTHADPSHGQRGSSRSSTSHASRPQRVLVIVQAARSIVLLAVAGLVTRSLSNLKRLTLVSRRKAGFLRTSTSKLPAITRAASRVV